MAKQTSIIDLKEKVNQLHKDKAESVEKINNYKERLEECKKQISNNFMVGYLNENIYKEEKNIEKYNSNIEKIEYQISMGGRKLKSNIAVSKDLVNARFSKQQYIPGVVGEGGCLVGEFKVIDTPTEVIVQCNINNKKLVDYLVVKYGDDARIENRGVIIKK